MKELTADTDTDTVPDDELQRAVEHHSAARYQDAERAYRAILQVRPDHADANHKLGILLVQQDQVVHALPFFSKAIDAAPDCEAFWTCYIEALELMGRPDEAREVLQRARQQGFGVDSAETAAAADERLSAEQASALAAEFIETLTTLAEQGLHDTVEVLARQMTSALPNHGFGWKALGIAVLEQGRFEAALVPLLRARALLPDDAELLSHLQTASTLKNVFDQHRVAVAQQKAIDQHRIGNAAQAEILFKKVLAIQPNHADANHNLGILAMEAGRVEEALPYFEAAIAATPHGQQFWISYANALVRAGRKDAAWRVLESAQQQGIEGPLLQLLTVLVARPEFGNWEGALASAPGTEHDAGDQLGDANSLQPEAPVLQISASKAKPQAKEQGPGSKEVGNLLSLYKRGRFAEAIPAAKHFTTRFPSSAVGWKVLGSVLFKQQQLEQARVALQKAAELSPEDVEVLRMLADTLSSLDEYEEAESTCRQLLAITPDDGEVHRLSSVALRILGRFVEAEASARSALEVSPASALVHAALGMALLEQGKLSESETHLRRSLEIEPEADEVHQGLLFCLTLNGNIAPSELAAEHRRFGERVEAKARKRWRPHRNSRTPDRRLQIGFVSGDLFRHAVANFIEPVLVHLARDANLTLHAYYTYTAEDVATQRLRGMFAHWHPVADMSATALADKIRADGIDILIDLSGQTARNRLVTFAQKPAPVQASWIGYPGTTGLNTVDYYFADRYLVPNAEVDDQFTEQIVYLPATAAFLPSEMAPPVNPLPALSNGYVTFGSFNRLNKLSREVVSLWSQVLSAMPTARMFVGAMTDEQSVNQVIDWFAQEGVSRERLDIRLRADLPLYLLQHHQVDICLDAFPYGGGTTSLHALWMGLPTVTLRGPTVASRSGTSVFSLIGLETFVADDKPDFVRKALHWARDLTALASVRSGMRERCMQSPNFRPEMIASGMSHALRIMWRNWCEGTAPTHLDVTQNVD